MCSLKEGMRKGKGDACSLRPAEIVGGFTLVSVQDVSLENWYAL